MSAARPATAGSRRRLGEGGSQVRSTPLPSPPECPDGLPGGRRVATRRGRPFGLASEAALH
jgi:hypothetical protein